MTRTTASTNRSDAVTGMIESKGQNVRYRVEGDGTPLLMINGIGAPLEFWKPLQAHLGGFQTIAVDPPGTGRSSSPRGRFRMRDYATVMGDLLIHLQIDRAHVIGLSLGGMMAQEFAHRAPERVNKLVLAGTTCGLGGVPVPPSTWGALGNPMRFISARHYRKIAPIFYGDGVLQDPTLLDEHMAIRSECPVSVRGYYAQLRAAMMWSSRPWLHSLRMPVLVVAGSEDRLVPVRNGRIIASGVRDGRLEVIEGGSHVCLLQEAAHTSHIIRAFLEEE